MAEPPEERTFALDEFQSLLVALNAPLEALVAKKREMSESLVLTEQTRAENVRLAAENERLRMEHDQTKRALEELHAGHEKTIQLLEDERRNHEKTGKALEEIKIELQQVNAELDIEQARIEEETSLRQDLAHCYKIIIVLKAAIKIAREHSDHSHEGRKLVILCNNYGYTHAAERLGGTPDSTNAKDDHMYCWNQLVEFADLFANGMTLIRNTEFRSQDSYRSTLEREFEGLFDQLTAQINFYTLWTAEDSNNILEGRKLDYPNISRPDKSRNIDIRWRELMRLLKEILGLLLPSFKIGQHTISVQQRLSYRGDIQAVIDDIAIFNNKINTINIWVDWERNNIIQLKPRTFLWESDWCRLLFEIKERFDQVSHDCNDCYALGQTFYMALDDRMFTSEWDAEFKSLVMDTIEKCEPRLQRDL